ncbi:MAG: WD40 repeat domain-containing serine/threonine protein kinase [Planctomycetota bacterium]
MATDREQRAEELFKAALGREPDERAEFVARECDGDTALRAEIETLLAADARASGFLEPPTGGAGGADDVMAGKRIGQYRVVRLIGSGGMGSVFEAMQDHPKRSVALKIIKSGFAPPSALRRFAHEADILARLRHAGIAQVYEAGTHEDTAGPVPFFAMEYITGAKTITEFAEENRLPTRDRLELFACVCDAVHHGHQRGVIHRDLKPGNIVVDASGQPKVIDFGVARATDADMTIASLHTDVGQLVGTLRYMSPEQCEGDSGEIDVRSDVYALGVVLYELLSGQLPYDLSTTSPFDIPRMIRDIDARRLSSIDRTLHGDVDTIVLKALEKDRERRYQSVADLGRDIRRYLDNEPIEAKRDSGWYVLRKTLSRHKAVVAVACAFLVLVIGSAVALGVLYGLAERQRALAEDRAEDLRRTAYFTSIALAQNAYETGNTTHLVRLLDGCPPDLRGWEWRYLERLSDTSIRTLRGHTGEVMSVAVSPDGSIIASGSRDDISSADSDNSIRLWDAASGAEIRTLKGHELFVTSVDFSPDGLQLASGSYDASIRLWAVETGEALGVLHGHEDKISTVAFSPDGRTIASAGADNAIRLWEVARREEMRVFRGHEAMVHDVAWSLDGRRIYSASWDKTVRSWDAETGREIRTFRGHENLVLAIAVSPNGRRIASSGTDNTLRIWDAETGVMLHLIRSGAEAALDVAFSPDGGHLAATTAQAVNVWEADTGRLEQVWLGHRADAPSVAYSPDGRLLVSGAKDSTVKVWDATRLEEPPALRGHGGMVRSVAVSPAERHIVSGGRDATVRVWDSTSGRELMALGEQVPWVEAVCVSSDASRIAAGRTDGAVQIWDAATGELTRSLSGHGNIVTGVAFSADDRLIASAGLDGTARIWETATGRLIHTFSTDGRLFGVAFSPDGRRIVSGGYGSVRTWEAESGRALLVITDAGLTFGSAVFSPDGGQIAAACEDWTVRVCDARTGGPVYTLRGHRNPVRCVAFSPDGRRLVSGGSDNLINVWDVDTGKLALTLRGHSAGVSALAFSPGGNWFVSASNDQTLRIWRADPSPALP